MSDTNESRASATSAPFALKPENGHGAGDEFPGEDFPVVPSTTTPLDDESSDDAPQDDEDVPDHTILEPGVYFFEVSTSIPCRPDILIAGLSRIGFTTIRLDQSRARSALQSPVREHRFLANVTKRIELHQGGALRWRFADLLDTDVPSDVQNFRMQLEAYELQKGVVYEGVFLARERSQPTRLIVEEQLNDMGFIIQALTCVQRDLRHPERENMSIALWFGLLEWDGPPSEVTEEDHFYFETLHARS